MYKRWVSTGWKHKHREYCKCTKGGFLQAENTNTENTVNVQKVGFYRLKTQTQRML